MRAKISTWGGSLAVRLPRAAVKSLRLEPGDEVEIVIEGDHLEIRAARPRYRLEDLLGEITPDNRPKPCHFPRVGKELP